MFTKYKDVRLKKKKFSCEEGCIFLDGCSPWMVDDPHGLAVRSNADKTFGIVEALICPLQISHDSNII